MSSLPTPYLPQGLGHVLSQLSEGFSKDSMTLSSQSPPLSPPPMTPIPPLTPTRPLLSPYFGHQASLLFTQFTFLVDLRALSVTKLYLAP